MKTVPKIMGEPPVLDVKNLEVFYHAESSPVRAVDGVNLTVIANEVLGIVGESGCGKSTLGRGVVRLVKPPGYINKGEVYFQGINLLQLSDEALNQLRLSQLSYIPQSSMSSLNPVMKIKDQIVDGITTHQAISKSQAMGTVTEVLTLTGLPPETADMYPHELSGGMRQRATIAIALALKPQLIVADEPTTALDVVVQKAVLEFLVRFKDEYGSSIIVISHDIAVQAEICDRLAVMYAGKMVEEGPIQDLFQTPLHPYTEGLIAATPSLTSKKELVGLKGRPPSLINPPPGCRFASRCPRVMNTCHKTEPPLHLVKPRHTVACHLY